MDEVEATDGWEKLEKPESPVEGFNWLIYLFFFISLTFLTIGIALNQTAAFFVATIFVALSAFLAFLEWI